LATPPNANSTATAAFSAPPLREFAALNKDVMLIGQGNKFEIWDDGAWNARRAEWLESEGEDDGKLPPDLESFSL
jgi:MraZ protein